MDVSFYPVMNNEVPLSVEGGEGSTRPPILWEGKVKHCRGNGWIPTRALSQLACWHEEVHNWQLEPGPHVLPINTTVYAAATTIQVFITIHMI